MIFVTKKNHCYDFCDKKKNCYGFCDKKKSLLWFLWQKKKQGAYKMMYVVLLFFKRAITSKIL